MCFIIVFPISIERRLGNKSICLVYLQGHIFKIICLILQLFYAMTLSRVSSRKD